MQVDASPTRKFGGTGLGLSISKRLAEILGGDVSVLDSRPGQGTRMRLTVAAGPLDGVRMIANPSLAHTTPAKPEDDVPPPRLDYNILLVEDGPDNQRLIAHILRSVGADVTIVENGILALDAVQEASRGGRPFNVILMDMQLPVLDGYETTRRLRQGAYKGPILALTAHALTEDRKKCIDAGCDEYCTKPIVRKKFLALVARLAQGRHGQEVSAVREFQDT